MSITFCQLHIFWEVGRGTGGSGNGCAVTSKISRKSRLEGCNLESQKSASALRDRWMGWEGDLKANQNQSQWNGLECDTKLCFKQMERRCEFGSRTWRAASWATVQGFGQEKGSQVGPWTIINDQDDQVYDDDDYADALNTDDQLRWPCCQRDGELLCVKSQHSSSPFKHCGDHWHYLHHRHNEKKDKLLWVEEPTLNKDVFHLPARLCNQKWRKW